MDKFMQNVLSEYYKLDANEQTTTNLIAAVPSADLAEFIMSAFDRGWITLSNLGLDEDGEIY